MGTMYVVNRLLFELSNNVSATRKLIEKMEVMIVPVINPDGYVYTHESLQSGESFYWPWWNYSSKVLNKVTLSGRWFRKNRRENTEADDLSASDCPLRGLVPYEDCVGVDINRNWDFGRDAFDKHMVFPCSFDFPGPEANSEIETKALKFLIEKNPQIHRTLDIHWWEQRLRWPMDNELVQWPGSRDKLYDPIVKDMAAALNSVHQPNKDEWDTDDDTSKG
jgi:hypothetical protein